MVMISFERRPDSMQIYGLIKTTLLDYPEHLAATIFTGGCNFRCPYCHNSSLITPNADNELSAESILSFLHKRKNILEGVCISGGEPTLQPDLIDFIQEIKQIGLSVKLDTNGSCPLILEELIHNRLIDYAAMDIKSSPDQYPTACGLHQTPNTAIEQSIRLLMQDNIPYEFRTTVVQELHSEETIHSICQWIQGCRHYYLQTYKDSDQVLSKMPMHPCSTETMEKYADIAREYIAQVSIRFS